MANKPQAVIIRDLMDAARLLIWKAEGNPRIAHDAVTRALKEEIPKQQKRAIEDRFFLHVAYYKYRQRLRSDDAALKRLAASLCTTEEAKENMVRRLRYRLKGRVLKKYVESQPRKVKAFFAGLRQ